MILGLAGWDGDDEPALRREDAAELLERRSRAVRVALLVGAVDAIVAPDVLERRDAEREVEGAVLERQVADVRDDRPHPGHVRLGQVDADELGGAAAAERREVGGLRVRRTDVEHALARTDPRERPRDLDRPLVRPRWRLEEPLAPGRDRVVEGREAPELVALDELSEERRPRHGALERGGLRVTAEDEPVGAADELLVGEAGELEVRLQAVVHDGRDGSFRAVLLALSTGHKVGLGLVAAVFIVFALSSSFLFPRYRPDFPGRRLGTFVLLTLVVFVGMLAAVEIFGREPAEKAEAKGETTTTTTATTTSGGGGGAAKTIQVKEREFKIELPSTKLTKGSYVFQLANVGHLPHDLTIQGPGVSKAHTPVINAGSHATLKVTLAAGTYDFYCSVPGHKQAGMDVKVTVS